MGHTVPLASFCLPDKKDTTYDAMMQMLFKLCADVAVTPSPSLVLLDFEDGMINTVRKALPHANIRACRFHFAQALVRRLQQYHKSLYRILNKEGDETGKWLKSFLGLPCLPAHMVPDAFVELTSVAPSNTGPCIAFSDYVLRTYVDSTRFVRRFI